MGHRRRQLTDGYQPTRSQQLLFQLLRLSAQAFLALAQCRFGAHPFDELTDLAADGLYGFQQILIRLANRCAENFDDAENFVAHFDRESQGAVQALGNRKRAL